MVGPADYTVREWFTTVLSGPRKPTCQPDALLTQVKTGCWTPAFGLNVSAFKREGD